MNTLQNPKFQAIARDIKILDDELEIILEDGRILKIPLIYFSKLQNASRDQLKNWELICRGTGIHWEEIDEDISIASLLGLEND